MEMVQSQFENRAGHGIQLIAKNATRGEQPFKLGAAERGLAACSFDIAESPDNGCNR